MTHIPSGERVLAVIARPGQESADLGGVLYAFRRMGASLTLLSLTRGEASPLNSTCQRLEAVRPWELLLAASVLGISSVTVADYPDGGLCRYPMAELIGRVRRAIRERAPGLLLVIDPAGGNLDDTAVATATCNAAGQVGLPVAVSTTPAARDSWVIDLGAEAATARALQRSAAAAHASQADALPRLERRLDLLDGREHMRWLVPPAPGLTEKTPGCGRGISIGTGRGHRGTDEAAAGATGREDTHRAIGTLTPGR